MFDFRLSALLCRWSVLVLWAWLGILPLPTRKGARGQQTLMATVETDKASLSCWKRPSRSRKCIWLSCMQSPAYLRRGGGTKPLGLRMELHCTTASMVAVITSSTALAFNAIWSGSTRNLFRSRELNYTGNGVRMAMMVFQGTQYGRVQL